jgi:hypothetical protein
MLPIKPLMLGSLALLTACGHTPRVVVAQDRPARIESFDRVTGQAEVIIMSNGKAMKGWMPMEELKGRTVILEDSWLK